MLWLIAFQPPALLTSAALVLEIRGHRNEPHLLCCQDLPNSASLREGRTQRAPSRPAASRCAQYFRSSEFGRPAPILHASSTRAGGLTVFCCLRG